MEKGKRLRWLICAPRNLRNAKLGETLTSARPANPPTSQIGLRCTCFFHDYFFFPPAWTISEEWWVLVGRGFFLFARDDDGANNKVRLCLCPFFLFFGTGTGAVCVCQAGRGEEEVRKGRPSNSNCCSLVTRSGVVWRLLSEPTTVKSCWMWPTLLFRPVLSDMSSGAPRSVRQSFPGERWCVAGNTRRPLPAPSQI